MKKDVIATQNAPAAVGPYSQAIRSGDLVFLSGQIAIDPATGKLVDGDVTAQAAQVCKNIAALLASQGLDMANVIKTTVFITDIAQFGAVNKVYAEYFTAPCPARSCVEVSALPLGALVEIETIATV